MSDLDDLLTAIRDRVSHPATARELAQTLQVPREGRAGFARRLKTLVASGDLVRIRGDRFGLPEKMDLTVGRLSTNPAGYGFVVPEHPEHPEPGARVDIYVAAANLMEAMHGDRVVARIERRTEKGLEGRVIRILERSHDAIVGRFEVDPAGLGYVVPFDRRVLADVQVPPGERGAAEPGEMVVVGITRWPTPTRGPAGRVIEVLGRAGEPGVDVRIIIRKFNIPDTHAEETIDEARRLGAAVREKDIRSRTDFRGVTTVTIDGEHARDFDDAITIERMAGGHYWLGVHIADVSHYVKEGSALDEEARERGTSVYFPERAVHMFPAELATGLCSLNPHVDRLVHSCLMEVDRRGQVVRYEMHDGVINSDARMTYTAVNAILTERDGTAIAEYRDLVPMFETMRDLFEILLARRRRRGAIDFDLPETEVVLSELGEIEAILPSERNVAHRIIEEFMLLANETVAAHLVDRGVPALHRVHEAPDPRKVEDFEAFISTLGYSLAAGAAPFPAVDRSDAGHAGGAADRGAHAPHDAEGPIRRRQSRPLRAGGRGLHPLHVSHPPVPGPRRPSHAAGVARHGRDHVPSGRSRGRAARDRPPRLGHGAPGGRGRAGTAAVEEGPLHGGQGGRRVRGIRDRRGAVRTVRRARRALRGRARARVEHG